MHGFGSDNTVFRYHPLNFQTFRPGPEPPHGLSVRRKTIVGLQYIVGRLRRSGPFFRLVCEVARLHLSVSFQFVYLLQMYWGTRFLFLSEKKEEK